MKRSDLMAALEERLLFYRELMRNLSEAVRDEDAERISGYTELETLEIAKIKALARSLEGLPRPADEAEAEKVRLLERRIAQASRTAGEASAQARKLLAERMADLGRRRTEARRASAGGNESAPPAPSFIDITL